MCVCVCVPLGLCLDLIQQSPFEVEIRKLRLSQVRAISWLHGREGIYKLLSHFHTVSPIPNGVLNNVFVRPLAARSLRFPWKP